MKLTIMTTYALCTSFALSAIYGVDDRKDWYEIKDKQLQEASLSVAVMFNKYNMNIGKTTAKLHGYKYGQSRQLCEDQKFINQRTGGVCSGFLVGPTTLVTAGHCVKTQMDCNRFKWIFDYKYSNELSETHTVSVDQIYSCKEIVFSRTSSNIYGDSTGKQDYAVIKLDRVVNKRPLKISSSRPRRGQKLTLIGYPNGLPLKIAQNGFVKKSRSKFFRGSVDAFGGNSGSPVLDAQTLEVLGILTSGRDDYPNLKNQKCIKVKNYSERGFKSETISSIQNIRNYL